MQSVLTTLRAAPPSVFLHLTLAVLALVLGIWQLTAIKGDRQHRWLGWCWVGLMAGVALASFPIHGFCTVGPFSPIHLLSVYVLYALFSAIRQVRRGNIAAHRRSMRGLFFGGLIVAGLFTLWPGRLMHQFIWGPLTGYQSCQ